MKLLFLLLILFVLSTFSFAQGVSTYQIGWDAVDETNITSYEVYYEERDSPTGFTLFNNLDPSNTNILVYRIATIDKTGQLQYIHEAVLNDDGKWVMVGVLTKNAIGQVSLLGALASPVQKQMPQLPTPSGIYFRLKTGG
jgi:hypothetical protein